MTLLGPRSNVGVDVRLFGRRAQPTETDYAASDTLSSFSRSLLSADTGFANQALWNVDVRFAPRQRTSKSGTVTSALCPIPDSCNAANHLATRSTRLRGRVTRAVWRGRALWQSSC